VSFLHAVPRILLLVGTFAGLALASACGEDPPGPPVPSTPPGPSGSMGVPGFQGPDGSLVQPAICQRYLDCLAAASPETLSVVLPTYGSTGTCWASDAATAATCQQACQTGFDRAVVDYEYVPGCGACRNDADCAGPTPFCQADSGLCVACRSDADCQGGQRCDTGELTLGSATFQCQACLQDADCTADRPYCLAPGYPGCDGTYDGTCDGAYGDSSSAPELSRCAECRDDYDCGGAGRCTGDRCATTCSDRVDCYLRYYGVYGDPPGNLSQCDIDHCQGSRAVVDCLERNCQTACVGGITGDCESCLQDVLNADTCATENAACQGVEEC
jgi:hypothetical protein